MICSLFSQFAIPWSPHCGALARRGAFESANVRVLHVTAPFSEAPQNTFLEASKERLCYPVVHTVVHSAAEAHNITYKSSSAHVLHSASPVMDKPLISSTAD